MPNQLPFYKMVASGNDFIVVDNRDKIIRDPKAFARLHCPQHTGIGADGVLLLERSKKTAFTMRIINSDGSEAEACGNGFRCIALYAYQILGLPREFDFEALAGKIHAKISGEDQICIGMVQPTQYQNKIALQVQGHRLHASFINTGVPHTVILVQGLQKIDVQKLGAAIRYHEHFKPKGTNVNFVEIKGPRDIQVRTYERGVEAETLACGTGSTASAVIAGLSGYVKSPVRVKTSGGEVLTIGFKLKGKKVSNVTLEGAAKFVFEGVVNLPVTGNRS